jgi:SAM-dependent methyltransferase
MHPFAYEFVATVAPNRPRGPVLEIGSKNINGSIRSLFGGNFYLGIDCVEGIGVDLVADGKTFKWEHQFATIVCCEVLEHLFDGEALCKNVYKLLEKGGLFIITAAHNPRRPHSAVDGGPLREGEFYANVQEDELKEWLKRFSKVEIILFNDDIYALAYK